MAREYATQMEAARKGIITEELKSVAKKERMSVEELLPLVAEGKVVICANKNHKCIDPQGVGSMLSTKINVNLGISWKPYIWAHMQLWIFLHTEIPYRFAAN